MTPAQLQKLLDKARLSQRGAAKELGINERHMRRYIAGDAAIPKHVEIAIRCICLHRTSETMASSGSGSNE